MRVVSCCSRYSGKKCGTITNHRDHRTAPTRPNSHAIELEVQLSVCRQDIHNVVVRKCNTMM
jgi:hypothetical protein